MIVNGFVLFSFAVLTTLTFPTVAGQPGAGSGGAGGSGALGFPGLPGLAGLPPALLNGGSLNGRSTATLFREIMKVLQASKSGPPPCDLAKAEASQCRFGEKTTEVCGSGCKVGECCLHMPGHRNPTCQPLTRSGARCTWQHCSLGLQANDRQAVYGDRCPCNDTCCLPDPTATKTAGSFQGMCSSFK